MIPETGFPSFAAMDQKDPKVLAARVQAMFLEVMIKSMEESIGAEGGLFGSSASSDIYRGMFREQLASSISAQMGTPLEDQLGEALSEAEPDHSHSHTAQELPVNGVVTSQIGWRRDPINGQDKFHKGIDIAAPTGTHVKAVANGTVVESGTKGGYGNTVVIETDDGRRMLYAHNQQNFVRVGDRVVRGDAIAAVGATGRATGPHVHFEVTE